MPEYHLHYVIFPEIHLVQALSVLGFARHHLYNSIESSHYRCTPPCSQMCIMRANKVSVQVHGTCSCSETIGLALPTPLMQSQIHELAKTLPPPRKQNTACDACRSGCRIFRGDPLSHFHLTDHEKSSATGFQGKRRYFLYSYTRAVFINVSCSVRYLSRRPFKIRPSTNG